MPALVKLHVTAYSIVSIREPPLVTKHTLTHIFIKYMHDIVLEISISDINSQNWITGSHLKLLQKSLKIQYIFQKFLCMANGPDKTDFWLPKKIWHRKITFIRPISHTKEFLKYV